MTRVLVHAGFYKTGTTSLQRFLAENRDTLAPHMAYLGPGQLAGSGAMARIYGQRPFPWRLFRFARSFRRALPPSLDRPLVISRENFCGAMPGHRDWRGRPLVGFPTAQRLLSVLLGELRRAYGPETRITLLFTTRERESWLESVHGHLLRSIPLTDDLAQFAARFPADFSLEHEVARLTRAFPGVEIQSARLEDLTGRKEGPAAFLLDLLDISEDTRERLVPISRANTGQDAGLRERFLALNRQGLSRIDLRNAKKRLMSR